MTIDVKTVRDRAWTSLSPQTAAAAGMTLADLQQFAGGNFYPSSEQLEALSRHWGLAR
jgi:hypothetical protein